MLVTPSRIIQSVFCVLAIVSMLYVLRQPDVRIPGLYGDIPVSWYTSHYGWVKQWHVLSGQKVKKGQVVAELEIPSIRTEIQQTYERSLQNQMIHAEKLFNLLVQIDQMSIQLQQRHKQNQSQLLNNKATLMGERSKLKTLKKLLPSFKQAVKVGQLSAKDLLIIQGEIAQLKARRHSLSQYNQLWTKYNQAQSLLKKQDSLQVKDSLQAKDSVQAKDSLHIDTINPPLSPLEHPNQTHTLSPSNTVVHNKHFVHFQKHTQSIQKYIQFLQLQLQESIQETHLPQHVLHLVQETMLYSQKEISYQQQVMTWIQSQIDRLLIVAPFDSVLTYIDQPVHNRFNPQQHLLSFYPLQAYIRAWHLAQAQHPPPSLNNLVTVHLPYAPSNHTTRLQGYVRMVQSHYSTIPQSLQFDSAQTMQGRQILIELTDPTQSNHIAYNTPLWITWIKE